MTNERFKPIRHTLLFRAHCTVQNKNSRELTHFFLMLQLTSSSRITNRLDKVLYFILVFGTFEHYDQKFQLRGVQGTAKSNFMAEGLTFKTLNNI